MKLSKWLIILIVIVVLPLYGGCGDDPFDEDDDNDCDDEAEDAFISVSAALNPRAALHPAETVIYEYCNPKWNCSCPDRKDRPGCDYKPTITDVVETCSNITVSTCENISIQVVNETEINDTNTTVNETEDNQTNTTINETEINNTNTTVNETIDQTEENCTYEVVEQCTNETITSPNDWATCNHYPSECNCKDIEFEEGCTRSPEIDDQGRYCGQWLFREPPSGKGCSTTGDWCVFEDGYMREAYRAHNFILQCFVGKYLHDTGGNPNDMTPYFPLPYPSIEVYSRTCVGEPEGTIYTYNKGGLNMQIEGQYHADCMSCRRPIMINGVGYDYRADPICGRETEGGGHDGSYCAAAARLNSS